ncbi:MAG: type II toxin-antitoxin system MqsA family antitoxin [Chloroflexi bacterium]|nr:type II toxin-antitoxin system MqsA family antitoxin [Chloroflexota bacterium]
MSDIAGNCPICGGKKHKSATTFTVDLEFGVVVVRDVPAWVCEQCGEAWIEDDMVVELEALVQEARLRKPVVEVTRWEPQMV